MVLNVELGRANSNGSSDEGSDQSRRIVHGPANPVEHVGLSGILQGSRQVQCVDTGSGTRDVLDEVGSLTVDGYRQIPVRVGIGQEGSVARGCRHVHRTDGRIGDVRRSTQQLNGVVHISSVNGARSQQDMVLGVRLRQGRIVGRSDDVDLGAIQVDGNIDARDVKRSTGITSQGVGRTHLVASATFGDCDRGDDTTGDNHGSQGASTRSTDHGHVSERTVRVGTRGNDVSYAKSRASRSECRNGVTANIDTGEVVTSVGASQSDLLSGQGYWPNGSGQVKHAVCGCSHSIDGVLPGVEQTNLNVVSHAISRLVDGNLSGLTEHKGLVVQLVVANVVTSPLVDGIINQVLQASNQIGGGFMRSVGLILVNVGNKERTGISQGHPLVAVARAMGSGSGTNKGTTSSVKLSISGRSNQVTLILLAVKRSRDALSVVLGDTLEIHSLTHDILDIVSVLHEHEVATHGQNLSHNRHIAVKGCGSDGNKAVLGVGGGILVIDHASITNVHRAANSRVRLDGLSHSGRDSSRDLTVVSLVAGNVVDRDFHRDAEPFAIGGVTGGPVAGNQLDAVDHHLHKHLVAAHEGRRQRGAVEFGGRRKELDLNDLVRSANANNAQVADLGVLEKLVDAVVAEEGNPSLGNYGGANANQLLIVI